MPDEDIWNLVAFLREMPTLDSAAYRQLVDKSSGHFHRQKVAVEADKRRTMDREDVSAEPHHERP